MSELQQKMRVIDSMIAEQRTVEFPNGEAYPGHSHYMHGLINGMISVQAILKDVEPVFTSLKEKMQMPLVPLTEMSGDHFEKVFLTGFAPSFIKTIVNTFQSLHGFHNAIAMYGHFKSHRVAVALGYDVEFTISEQQGSELSRARNVREKLDALKRGNYGIAWTGMRLTMNEYLEGETYFEIMPSDSEVMTEDIKRAYNVFKMRRPV